MPSSQGSHASSNARPAPSQTKTILLGLLVASVLTVLYMVASCSHNVRDAFLAWFQDGGPSQQTREAKPDLAMDENETLGQLHEDISDGDEDSTKALDPDVDIPVTDGLAVYVDEALEDQFDAEDDDDDEVDPLAQQNATVKHLLETMDELEYYPPYNASVWGERLSGPSNLVLITAAFGESVHKPHLRFFLKSVRDCGADVLIVGDPPPQLPLPSNVRHLQITWQDMWERVRQHVPDCGIDPAERAKAPGYKVIDLKPLYGVLLADEIKQYTHWGHIDNDMILGDVRKFLPPPLLFGSDVISGLYHKNTWGPFCVFRNIPKVNDIFRRAPELCTMLNDAKEWGFDEKFGRDGNNMHEIVEGVVTKNRSLGEPIDVVVHKGMPVGWDGKDNNGYLECELHCPPPQHPGPCRVIRRCRYFSKRNIRRCWVLGYGNKGPEMEVLLCHFQYSKGAVNQQLATLSPLQLKTLALQPSLVQNKAKGFFAPELIPIRAPPNMSRSWAEQSVLAALQDEAESHSAKQEQGKPKITILTD